MPEEVDSEAVRVEALANVVADTIEKRPDEAYSWRHIKRWYSRTFSTPLADVDEVSSHDLLLHYWESHYESLDVSQLEDTVIGETRGLDKVAEARAKDDAYHARIEREELEKAKKAPAPKPAPKAPPPPPQGKVEFFDPTSLDSLGAAAQEALDMIPKVLFPRQSPT